MMAGERLSAIAERFLREDTFALMAEPAIADFQFEAATARRWRLLRGYTAVCCALVAALCHDAAGGLRTFAGLVLLQACYYTCLLAFLGGLTGASTQAVVLLGGVMLLSVVPVAICFWAKETA
jgi:hypothetical protein